MKIQWSAFLSLFTLATLVSCSGEQFGTVPKSTTENYSGTTSVSNKSCAESTLVKPKVDIIYVVDNSGSANVLADATKTSIKNTIDTVSQSFDFRVIVTPLLATSSGNDDYQVLTNSSDPTGIPTNKIVSTSSDFNFFKTPQSGQEVGLRRVNEFVQQHQSSGLLRSASGRAGSHLIVVLISNGRDQEVEGPEVLDGPSVQKSAIYSARVSTLKSLRENHTQLRFFSVTAKTHLCQTGYWSANLSYVPMAKEFGSDDSYDLCGSGLSTLFSGVNSSIQQQILAHGYRYWPVNFSSSTDLDEMKVYRVTSSGSNIEMIKDTDYSLLNDGVTSRAIRETPSVGETTAAPKFLRFTNLVTYPDCVLIQANSKTEYFGYYVMPTKPVVSTISVRLNGNVVSSSTYTLVKDSSGNPLQQTVNIKMDNSTATPKGESQPPLMKTGYMLKINSSANYYKSGDTVEINYSPAGI